MHKIWTIPPHTRQITIRINRNRCYNGPSHFSLRLRVPMLIRDMAKVAYAPVGRCIYCSKADDLRREHILPFGLSGTAVLPKASCGDCAKITGKLEEMVLRGPMWPLRVFRDLKSRSKHKDSPTTLPISVVRAGEKSTIHLSIDEYPILLMFPIFALPGSLFPSGSQHGITHKGHATVSFGPKPEEVAARLGADQISIEQEYRIAEFARVIAKIAYAFAFAEGAITALDGPSPAIPSILGHSDEIGHWVGTRSGPHAYPNELHRLVMFQEQGHLIVEVQLFADSETPSYGVVLGKLK